jgi:hypothetical protein
LLRATLNEAEYGANVELYCESEIEVLGYKNILLEAQTIDRLN